MKRLTLPFVATLLASFVLLGCDCDSKDEIGMCLKGTGTGNPVEPINSNTPGEISRLVSYKIISQTCAKVSACHGDLTYANCESSLISRSDIDVEVGVPEGQYSRYSDVIIAESEKKVREGISASTCLEDVRALSCDDATVDGAYDPTRPDPFEFVTGMFPTSCSSALALEAVAQAPAPETN